MNKSRHGRRLTSLRGLLQWWIIGSGVVLVILYFSIIEYNFRFGVTLKTKAYLEQVAVAYERNYTVNSLTSLPSSLGIQSYKSLDDIPPQIKLIFPEKSYEHGEIQVYFIDHKNDDFFDLIEHSIEWPCEGGLCNLIFFYSHQLNDQDWLYMTQGIAITDQITRDKNLSEYLLLIISLITLVLFSALALLLIQRIDKPVQQLANWADSLTLEQLNQPVPDFQYQELNRVADRLNGAFEKIAKTLEKEHRFLQNASHELRTPIAVASGNLELLNKLKATYGQAANTDIGNEEQQAFERLTYAVKDMQQLTETLLWLNRDMESVPVQTNFNLTCLIHRQIDDNQYLLQYKTVSIQVIGPEVTIEAPMTLCSIIFANLIRNAFQYTYEGHVQIEITPQAVTIQNTDNSTESADADDEDADYGFGLGLDLVQQIAQRLGWRYEYEVFEKGRCSSIYFA